MMRVESFSAPLLFACVLALTGCAAPERAAAGPAATCEAGQALGASEAGLEQVRLCIDTGGKTLPFTVELAQSPAEQQKGLMFRTELADDAGMLFPFERDRMASFWMKNTVIPLDMVFVRRDGTIESIAANTVPYSLDPVSSGERVAAVLELRGGLAAERGIEAGDRVGWQANDN